ncbi:stress responsive A/B barrel domain-containing protein [Purpureocillium lavendulum]|uniref:Stress responsive A/B barrel domain-containing protein n=1 Tax=Purpureocillium lavendulum TaxID=1247861 RepID=A0AB34FRU3_9HYPO|nr:stress responsive A/B barrel domain-containing protein [Purpureocillium lavendulum]
MASQIHRVTLFKIPDHEHQERLLGFYKQMKSKALKVRILIAGTALLRDHDKDGKPYILSVTAGNAKPDQRAQGFTFAAISVFSSVEDMVYYDNECAAHAELKAFAKTVHQGAMMVYFENGAI